jgi:hypothetical protein
MNLLPQFSSGDVVSVLWNPRISTKELYGKGGKTQNKKRKLATNNSEELNTTGASIITNISRNAPPAAPHEMSASSSDNDPRTTILYKSISTIHSDNSNLTKIDGSVGYRPFHVNELHFPEITRLSIEDDSSSTNGSSLKDNSRDQGAGDSIRVKKPEKQKGIIQESAFMSNLIHDDDILPSDEEDTEPKPKSSKVILCSVYWDITKQELPKEFTKLVKYCKDKSLPLLLCGDMNAHSEFWGSTNSNKRGETPSGT